MTAEDRLKHYIAMANAGDELPEEASLGPPVQIWRLHRDGRETLETLPEFLAQHTMANIVHEEPDVVRAKIIRRSPNLDSLLVAELTSLFMVAA